MTRKSIAFVLALAAVVLAALALLPDAPLELADAAASRSAPAREQAATARSDAPATRIALPASAPAPTRGDCAPFAEMLLALTRIWEVSRSARGQGRDSEVELGKVLFEATVEGIRRCYHDAGERALLVMSEAAGGPVAAREPDLQCGGHLVRLALADLLLEFRSSQNRASLDAMVHSLLATLELDETLGKLIGEHLLAGGPHLGKAHEQKVLAFLVPDEARKWLRPIGEQLLLTLWRNLVAEGALSAAEMERLAMVLANDPNSPQRHAAILQLLCGKDVGHLPWILSLMEHEKDRSFLADVAMAVAAVFEPKVSLDALVQMQSRLPSSSFTAAWIAMGTRSPQLLQNLYESRLADGIDAVTRYELVGGMGFGSRAEALGGLRIAFENDPDPRVRGRALLCAAGGPSRPDAERMLRAASADPAFLPSFLAMGLTNYCGKNPDPSVVQEIGERLLARPTLAAEDRAEVRTLMDRFTPAK